MNIPREEKLKKDLNKLDYEKSLLIRNINHNISDSGFYDRRIPEYKIYATIQTLLNEWRSNSFNNIVKMAQFEEQLKEWLLQSKNTQTLNEGLKFDADPLVEKLMIEKINDRYKNDLTEQQSDIIRSYILSKDSESLSKLGESFSKIKNSALENIENYLNENIGKDKYLDEKLKMAKDLIIKENIEDIDDQKVERFLDISKLTEELRN